MPLKLVAVAPVYHTLRRAWRERNATRDCLFLGRSGCHEAWRGLTRPGGAELSIPPTGVAAAMLAYRPQQAAAEERSPPTPSPSLSFSSILRGVCSLLAYVSPPSPFFAPLSPLHLLNPLLLSPLSCTAATPLPSLLVVMAKRRPPPTPILPVVLKKEKYQLFSWQCSCFAFGSDLPEKGKMYFGVEGNVFTARSHPSAGLSRLF